MTMSAVMSWLGKPLHLDRQHIPSADKAEPLLTVDQIVPLPDPSLTDPTRPPLEWTPGRIATTDALWGDGYQIPGGEIEALRLAKPLGLSAASSLLLLGAGGGGAPCSVATKLGAWVSGFDIDPVLVEAANARIARRNLSRRAQMETWDPANPGFRAHFFHHGMMLEALHGCQPEHVLAAVAGALKPSGHLAMIELIADRPLDPANPVAAAWARLERRDVGSLPTEVAITRALRRLRFDVRVVEDLSDRHVRDAMAGWRTSVRGMENVRPSRREAMHCVEEAELWMLRLRLFHLGLLRIVRWHAIGVG